jgi:hypothetical protein
MAGCTCAVARAACVPTAAGCAAAAAEPVRVVGSALPRRSHSTTQSIGQRCRGRPRTSDDTAVLPIGSDSHDPQRNAHAHASGGGRPGAIQLRTSLHPA